MIRSAGSVLVVVGTLMGLFAQENEARKESRTETEPVSFSKQVYPIIKKHCLPCHAEENYNPSELSLDSFDQLMSGGKHGVPVIPGKSEESILIQKLGPKPPFGDPMPLERKKKNEPSKRALTQDEITVIGRWIDQGGKNN